MPSSPWLRIFTVALGVVIPTTVWADPPGAQPLEKARAAWEAGDFEGAEPAYVQALAAGGLSSAATLECYVHLGSLKAILGKRDEALSAFRSAAFLDGSFEVPVEAGKKATTVADQARRLEKPLSFQASAPSRVESGTSFAVNVTIDALSVPKVARVGLSVKDKTTNKNYAYEEKPQTVVHFSVPANMVLPNATLTVHVAALDPHDNQLASVDQHVEVSGAPMGNDAKSGDKATNKPAAGFWSTAWPWVIGSTALALLGVGIYFAVRPADQVSVGAPTLQPQ